MPPRVRIRRLVAVPTLFWGIVACDGADARPAASGGPPPLRSGRSRTDSTRFASRGLIIAPRCCRARGACSCSGAAISSASATTAAPRPATRANIKSASKSVISALVGIAIAAATFAASTRRSPSCFRPSTRALDPAKARDHVEDLLSMRAGLQSTSFDNYGAWVTSRNWVRDALRRPMVGRAGRADDLQHRQHASAVGDPHARDRKRARTRTPSGISARPLGITLRGGRPIRRASTSAATTCT